MPARRTKSQPGRPRSKDATREILAATLDLLAKKGYHATTLDSVAAAIGSSKPTIYRRWKSKSALVADAFVHALASASPDVAPSTNPRADVRKILGNVIHALTHTPLGGAVRAVVAVAGTEPAFHRALRDVEARRRGVLTEAVVRIVQDRERADLEVDRLLGAIYFRFLVRRVRIDEAFAGRLAQSIGHG